MNKICVNCGPHDASVTILKDDKIIAHILEERHTNITHDGAPMLSLTKVKDYIKKFDFVSFTHLFSHYIDLLPYMRTLQYMGGLDEKVNNIIDDGEMLHKHHDYHAMCGFVGSGFEDAVVVVIDGAGSTFDYGKENQTTYDISLSKFNILEKYIVGDGSIVDASRPSYVKPITNIGAGYCYTAVTECIGFGALECGKTMGLAPYGEDDSRISELLSIDSGGNESFTLGQNPRWPWMGDVYAIFNDSLLWQDPDKWKGKIKKVLGISDEEIEEDPKKYFSSEKPTCIGDPFLSAQDRKLLERQKGREIDRQNRIETIVANAKRTGKEVDPSSVDLPDLKPWNPCGPQVETNDLYLTEFDRTTKDSVVLERLRKDKAARGKPKSKEEMETGPKNIVCNPLPKGGPGVFGTFPIPKYMPDPYRQDEFEALERRKEARKNRNDEESFKKF